MQTTPFPPHKHALAFDVAPLVCVQSGAATHRQNLELEVHRVMEVDCLLKYRLLLSQKHPGGLFDLNTSSATTSFRPMLSAATSHAALSKIDVRLLTSTHILLPSSLIYPNAPKPDFRQDPPPYVE